jgi:hypothetical protein
VPLQVVHKQKKRRESVNNQENIKYQLETLGTYEPDDIDNPEFEVAYEDDQGNEGFATVSCIDLASESLTLINAMESRFAELEQERDEIARHNHELKRWVSWGIKQSSPCKNAELAENCLHKQAKALGGAE